MNMTYKEILPGVKLRVIESGRFETNCVSVQFLAPIDEKNASVMTLIPRVLRRGTTKHPDMESLAAALDDMYGARVEPVSRKYGALITSGFVCDFVDLEEKLLHPFSKLLGEIMFDPKVKDGAFLEEYVSGERMNLIDEIKSEINNKLSYAHRRATEKMFKNSAYAVSELGTESAAESIDAKSLFRHYKKMISTSPCEIFFCGKYSCKEVEREIVKLFSLCSREKAPNIKTAPAVYSEDIRMVEKMDVAQANLLVGMHTDSDDVYASKLLSAVIGGGTTSKLFTNVREKKSLCYFAGATFDSFQKSMFLYCGIDPKNSEIAERAMLNEFENCLCGNITDEEIADAKKGMIDDIITTEDSLFSMEAFWLRATLLGDERTPIEIASEIKNIDGSRLAAEAGRLKKSVTYLLTGLEGTENARKLLPDA